MIYFRHDTQPSKQERGKVPQFMVGVPGVHAFTEQPKAFKLQKIVQKMCEWKRFVIKMIQDEVNLPHIILGEVFLVVNQYL